MKQRFNQLRTRLLACWYVLTSKNYIGIGWGKDGMAQVAHNNKGDLLHRNLFRLGNMHQVNYDYDQMDALVSQAKELVKH